MNIQTKLTLGASTLVAVALIATSVAIGFTSTKQSEKALTKAMYDALKGVAALTHDEVHEYLDGIKRQIQVMSTDPRIIEETQNFRQSFSNYNQEAYSLPDSATQRQNLKNYYLNQFGRQYQAVNGESTNIDALINALDDNTIALQYSYISANSNPLGSKDVLDRAQDNTRYSDSHLSIHPHMRSFLNQFGFYDIFIADAKTGHIIYSVYKELDFATSLINGPYANAGIGEAFRQAASASNVNDVYLTDFAPYLPSYEAAAYFISSPIFNGQEKIGVLIFQMPVDKLNQLMTHGQKWKNIGLGNTGESILVGEDKTLRSLSRGIVENKAAYLGLLEQYQLADSQTIKRINQLGSNLLLQTVDNPAVEAALNGKTGTTTYTNYTGETVLTAYTPIKFLDQTWAILAKIDQTEATAAQQTLVNNIVMTTIIFSVVMIAIAIFAVTIFSHSLTKPLRNTIAVMEDLSRGEGDLTARLQANSDDELGVLSANFNQFIEKIQSLMVQVETEVYKLTSSASVMDEASTENKSVTEKQKRATQEVSHSMNEMSIASHEVAQSASAAEESAKTASEASAEGTKIVSTTTQAIQELADNMAKAVNIIQQLESSSDNIGSVVGVISGIAEQTNLLALNAAIEAARAGEQGRGFAVVADEVRALASRTQESTIEINGIVEELQQNANCAVSIMNTGYDSVNLCVKEADKAKITLESILQQIKAITDMNLQIATSAEEQSAVGKTMNENLAEIDTLSTANANSADTVLRKNLEVNQSISSINGILKNFKLR